MIFRRRNVNVVKVLAKGWHYGLAPRPRHSYNARALKSGPGKEGNRHRPRENFEHATFKHKKMATITSWRQRRRVAPRRTTPLRTIASGLIEIARAAFAEPYQLAVERHAVALKRLPRELDGLRVVHLSDIHHGPLTAREQVERAVEVANSLQPDIVALTGDYVSHEREYVRPCAEMLGRGARAGGQASRRRGGRTRARARRSRRSGRRCRVAGCSRPRRRARPVRARSGGRGVCLKGGRP